MRKVGGVLLAVAMVLPVGLAASPAGAAGGTTCKANTGVSTFKPALPIQKSKATVNSTTTGTGKITGCTGGGVTGGTFKSVFKYAAYNCAKLLSYNPTPRVGTITTTWSNHQTSTGSLTLHAIKGNLTKVNVTGTIASGQFKGLKLTTSFTFGLVTKGGCVTAPLATVSIKSASLIVIK
jgi:hypothetical protein